MSILCKHTKMLMILRIEALVSTVYNKQKKAMRLLE